ncbi:hypothetical protein FS749_016185 [Ceratobasidium sp. UAMH 11750]|nr:hypothetical protein FS749_016185 [Ceratobasidium sp. UAMH 11750]
MLLAIPVIIAAIAAYVPFMTLLLDSNSTIWHSQRALSESTTVGFILQIEAFVHQSTVSWLMYFPDDLRLYLGLPPIKTPRILFEEVDLAWGSCRKDDRFSTCVGPGHSFLPEIIVYSVPVPPETFIATLMRVLNSWLQLNRTGVIIPCLGVALIFIVWSVFSGGAPFSGRGSNRQDESSTMNQEFRQGSQDPPNADPCSSPPPTTTVDQESHEGNQEPPAAQPCSPSHSPGAAPSGRVQAGLDDSITVDQESQDGSQDSLSTEASSPFPVTAVNEESQEAGSQDPPRSPPIPATAADQASEDPPSDDPSPLSPATERPPAPSQTAGRSLPSEDFYRRFYGVNGFRPDPNRKLSPLERGILPPGTVTFPTVGSPFAGTARDPALWRRPPVPGSIGFDPAHRGPRPTTSQQPSAGESSASGSGLLNSMD